MKTARHCARFASGLMLALCTTLFVTTPQASAALGDVGFEIKLTESEMVLEHPGDMQYKMFAMWDSPYQRIAARSMPWIEVKNDVGSTGNLTQFSMTIGDTNYNFSNSYMGQYATMSDSTPNVSFSSVVSTGNVLTLTFANGGLAPGQIARFGIDIDPDANVPGLFPHPDFRLVLFDMNNLDGKGDSDNSIMTATFTDPNNPAMTALAETQLPDYTVTGPQSQYFNQFVRPYGVMEGIDVFTGGGGNTPIPEPSSWALVGLGLAGVAAVRWRRR
jgi:hypothetical protein